MRLRDAAAFAIAVLLPAQARADLIQKVIQTDTAFAHVGWVIDTQLSPGQNGHESTNWQWAAVQKLANDGHTWVIEVGARHVRGPHSGEAAAGEPLLLILPYLVPGHSGHATVRKPHPGLGHFDTLTVGYLPVSSNSSRLTIALDHPPSGPGDGGRWSRIPWKTGVGILVLVGLLAGGISVLRRTARRP